MRKKKNGSEKAASNKTVALWLDEFSMKEAAEAADDGRVVIFPVGSVEEHGDHLPLCTDSLQPEYVALEASRRTGCVVAPSLRYGVCSSTRNFPGTVSVRFESLHQFVRDVLEELVRNGFLRILVLSGHAGKAHMTALRLAAQDIVQGHQKSTEDRKKVRIMVCSDYDFAYELRGKCFDERDGHAGTIETSRVMVIRPDLVKGKGKKCFPEFPRFEVVADVERFFPSGVIGDPTAASTEKGRMINDYVINEVVKLVEELKR